MSGAESLVSCCHQVLVTSITQRFETKPYISVMPKFVTLIYYRPERERSSDYSPWQPEAEGGEGQDGKKGEMNKSKIALQGGKDNHEHLKDQKKGLEGDLEDTSKFARRSKQAWGVHRRGEGGEEGEGDWGRDTHKYLTKPQRTRHHFGHQSGLYESSERNSSTLLYGIALRVYLLFSDIGRTHNINTC